MRISIIQCLVVGGIACAVTVPALADTYLDYSLSSFDASYSLSQIVDISSGTLTNLGGGEESYQGPLISSTVTNDGAIVSQTLGGTANMYYAADCCFRFNGILVVPFGSYSFPMDGLFSIGSYNQGGNPSTINSVDLSGSSTVIDDPQHLMISEVPAPVPLPTTWLLMAGGLFALAPAARRRIRNGAVTEFR